MTTKDEALALALEAHKKLIRAYINLLETGRDRIISHGGTCDSVEQMEASDPALREAREAITAIKQAQDVALINEGDMPITSETGNAATPEASAITAGNGQAQEPVEPLFYHRPTCNGEMYEGPWHANSTQVRMFPQEKRHELVPLCAWSAPKQAEPEGYKRVPVEPDETMLSCGDMNLSCGAYDVYRAMLAAAPTPPEAA
jgi:hypothetical protein